jgi:hypothetical protein
MHSTGEANHCCRMAIDELAFCITTAACWTEDVMTYLCLKAIMWENRVVHSSHSELFIAKFRQ